MPPDLIPEKSPSRIQTEKHLKLLSNRYSEQLGIDKSLLENLLTRSFTEKVGSEVYFKPNALPYLFRAQQLDGKLSSDPELLRKQLNNTWLAIVDVSNLKLINEMEGSSHAVGDSTINLHTRSVVESTAEDTLTSHCLVRFMGDEFADFINHPDQEHSTEQLKILIDKQTKKLIEEAKSNTSHPLYQIATDANKVKYIGKVVKFAKIQDIEIPIDTRRIDDLVEVMHHATEELNIDPLETPSTPDKKILHTISQWDLGIDSSEQNAKTTSSIDTIIRTINQTDFTLTLSEEIIQKNDSRKDQIIRYLPPSLSSTWENALRSVQNDAQKLSRTLTLFEEALFNSQFSRNPPILNDWVFDELAKENKNDLNQFQMVSTPLPKLYNTVTNRLGATSLLKDGAKKTLTLLEVSVPDNSQLNYIIKKQGASLYVLMNEDTRSMFKKRVKQSNKEAIKNIASATSLGEFFRAARDYLFHTPITVKYNRYSKHPEDELGSRYESLRHIHYLGEMAHLLRELKQENANSNILNLLLYYISERSSTRLELLNSKNTFNKNLYTLLESSFLAGK